MARTQAVDYDQKRDSINAAAARVFAQKGFGGASLSDIAQACETSKSLIYHYYPSKEAILYDVMTGHMDDLLSVCTEIDARNVDDIERFRGFSRVLLRHYVGAADSQKILVYEINNLPAGQQDSIIAKQRQLIDYAEALLARTNPNHGLDRPTLRAKIMLFFGMLNWSHTWFRNDGPIERNKIADMASDAALKFVSEPV